MHCVKRVRPNPSIEGTADLRFDLSFLYASSRTNAANKLYERGVIGGVSDGMVEAGVVCE